MSTATEEIRGSRNSLEIELRKLNKTIRGSSVQCPFHEDTHASASIHRGEDGAWRLTCHVPTCAFHGDVFDVRAKLQGRTVAEVLREVSPPEPERAKAKRIFATVEDITRSVSGWCKVEACYEYANPKTGETEVVQIRCVEGDRKKFYVHHAAPGGFVMGAPPKPWPIYNRGRVDKANAVVVVEGEKCVHALHKIGICATTSLSGAGNADKADWAPLAGKTVYVWPDNDAPGMEYAKSAIAKLDELTPRPEVYLLAVDSLGLPVGGDVVDFIAAGGGADEVWCVLKDGSEPAGAHTDLLVRVLDIVSGKWSSIDWPFKKLSEASKALFPGTITVLCGDPAASKSFFLLQAMQWWHKQGINVALMELEDDRAHHMLRLLAVLSGTWDVLNDTWGRDHKDEFLAIYERNRRDVEAFSPCIFAAPMGQVGYPQMLEWIEARCAAGAKIIAIDPITAVYTGESRQIEDLTFICKASAILRKYESRLILITHPRTGATKRAASSQDDIAGGRAFSRHTQNVLWLHRHDPAKQLTCVGTHNVSTQRCNRSLHICKARNGPGHGWKLGFSLDKNVQFVEHGVVTAEQQSNDVSDIPSW